MCVCVSVCMCVLGGGGGSEEVVHLLASKMHAHRHCETLPTHSVE